jgi:hypothetical protein
MGYGDKYYKRFHAYGPGDLTPEGLAWMDRTGVALQEGIDAQRIADPAAFAKLEENNEAFRRFAYDGHPRAYIDSGLLELPVQDLQKIGRTPDFSDLLSKDGLKQVWDVAKEMKPSDYWNITKSTAGKAASDTGKVISNAWEGIKSWF